MNLPLALAPLLGLAACHAGKSDDSDTAPVTDDVSIASDRPVLLYTDDTPVTDNAAQLPEGWTEPDQTVCAEDPTRQYIGEIFENGIDDIQVDWHWAPIVPGPDPERPTVDQPEWWYAGEILSGNDSGDDVLADHPFGLDYSFDVTPDEPYAFMPTEGGEEGEGAGLHCEIEQGTFPRDAWDYHPATADRTLLRGVWVLDCGHPPYSAEMHPPTFLSFASQPDATTTSALAFVAPYRSALLFNPDVTHADDFADEARYTDADSLSFPHAFIASVLDAVAGTVDNLSSPALMVANKVEPVDFLVCAPLPRPDGAVLDAKWHFAARTGVTVTVTEEPEAGCARVQASASSSYVPMELPYASAPWPWDELSASATGQLGDPIDVRQAIIDALAGIGIDASEATALQEDHPPMVDAYADLEPPAGISDVSGQVVETASDAQPFPWSGRLSVGWR